MSGHYRSRWASTTGTGRTSPLTRRGSLSSTVEPSTYGTSWNSVRWNKPATSGYRSHSARIRDSFESRPSYNLSSTLSTTRASSTPKYNTSNAVKVAQDMVSLGPTVSQRASRFDSSAQDKYREEARELLEKYTSRDRTGPALSSMKSGYYSRHFEPKKLGDTSTRLTSGTVFTTPTKRASSAYRSSVTPTRSLDPPSTYSSTSRYSVERTPAPSYTPIITTSKERPWRTRLAEAARLRATVGDEASASYTAARASRRGSLSQASGDESLTRELNTLRNSVASTSRPVSPINRRQDKNGHIVQIPSSGSAPPYRHSSRQSSVDTSYGGATSRYSTPASSVLDRYPSVTRTGGLFTTSTPKPYMSRSFSPVRSPLNPFQSNSTSRLNSTRSLSPSTKETLKRVPSSEKTTISTAPTTSPIQEGNEKENENRDRRTQMRSSSKARAARRASRQREAEKSSSSEAEDRENRSLSRQRRRQKKKISKETDGSALQSPENVLLDSRKPPEMILATLGESPRRGPGLGHTNTAHLLHRTTKMPPPATIHQRSHPSTSSTTHQPEPIEIPVVQAGRVRLVMRNGYISRLLGAGEPTFEEFESDSSSDSENDFQATRRSSTSKAPSTDKAARALYATRPIASVPTYRTSRTKILRATFIGPKSGDPEINQARYHEFVTGVPHHAERPSYPTPLTSFTAPFRAAQRAESLPKDKPSNYQAEPSKPTINISLGQKVSKQPETINQVYQKPLRPPSKSGALISKIKSTLEFRASGNQMKGVNIGVQPQNPQESDISKPSTSKIGPKPSKISNFFNKVLRKTPKSETKEEKPYKAPVHCQIADERVIHGFTLQKPTVVAELDNKIKQLPKSPQESPRSKRKSSTKAAKSVASTTQKVADPLSPKPSPSLKLKRFLKKATSRERLVQTEKGSELEPEIEKTGVTSVEPKPGSPKTLVQVEKRDNGRFKVPELKRVTSPIMKPKKPATPPQYSFATSGKSYLSRKQYAEQNNPALNNTAPLADMDEIMDRSEKAKSPDKPLGIVRPFSRTGNPQDRNLPIGPLPGGHSLVEERIREARETHEAPNLSLNQRREEHEGQTTTANGRQRPSQNLTAVPTPRSLKISSKSGQGEADHLRRLQELETQLKEHQNRLDQLANQPLVPQPQPATVIEKRVIVRYDDNLVRKPQKRKEPPKVSPKPSRKEIPEQPMPWIVQPSPLDVEAYIQKANEQNSRWGPQTPMSPHSAASLAASSTGRPFSPTSPSNLVTLEEKALSPPPSNPTLVRKMVPKSPRDLLNPIPKSENSIPLWRIQNTARFGKEQTKSLVSPSASKDELLNSEMAKSAPPSTLLLADKVLTEEESAVSFHTPPPEPTITVAPPTPVSTRKPLEIETTAAASKRSLKIIKDTKLGSPSCIPWDSSFELAEVYSDASVIDDESQYSAVTHFVPKKIKKPPVPGMWLKDGVELISKNKHFKREEEAHTTVFIWKLRRLENTSKDLKTLTKKTSKPSASMTEKKKMVVKKKRTTEINPKDVERAMKEREISPIGRRKQGKEAMPVEVSVSANLQNKQIAKQAAVKRWLYNERLALSNQKPFKAQRKAIPLALAVIDKDFHKKRMDIRVQKLLKEFGKQQESHSLKCKAATNRTTKTEQNLSQNQSSGGAKVIVVSAPIDNVNVSRIKHKCKASRTKKERNSMPCYRTLEQSTSGFEEEKEKLRAIQANNGAHSDTEYDNEESQNRSKREGSVAAAILDEMRGKDSAVDWSATGGPSIFLNNGTEPLILPDQSILEEYVKRKRGRLERLHSEPIPETEENRSECDSPCNSTASEFIPASAVRVHEPSSRGVPVITTAPQKSRSRMSSGEPQTPTAMVETQQPLNNFNSTPQAFLRHERRQVPRPILFQAPQSFDVPKTPFESALQQQANQIARRASINSLSTYSEPGECRSEATAAPPLGHVRQTSQDGSISSSFTAALAANQPARHERYAAHIPVNRGDGSGRQSVNSVDSQASGALETATKQLDQVIDQARYRHHQHRSRFKEAIDYLDQIFEDLKRECDTGAQQASSANAVLVDDDANNNNESEPMSSVSASQTSTMAKEMMNRRPQPAPSVVDPSPSYATQSLPNRSSKHRPQNKPPSPIEADFGKQQSVKGKLKKSPDSEVAETIVLPKKPDKLDFTRKWLQDDLSSFGMSSPAPLVIGPEMTLYTDVDEHSLGSCSAEVAAINENTKSKKKEKKSSQNKPKPHADVKPVKPQALRPQPQYPTSSGNNGPRQFPVDFEPAPSLPRVASFDHMSDRGEQNGWRSGSQEPYNNSLTLHPNDPRPSPSAFQNVSPSVQRNSLRGSIRSLPDTGRVPSLRPTPDPPRDPGLAIDALVAELELNTEESALAEKRRSFPTAIGRLNEYEQPRQRANPPTQPRRTTQPVNYSHGYQQPPAPSQPILPTSTYSNPIQNKAPVVQKQANLDEMASMLASVANEFSSVGSPPQSRQQNGRRASLPRQNSGSGGGGISNQSFIYAVPHMHAPPFETINKERINPSRVEAMQNVFDVKPNETEWRRGPQPYKGPSREEENYYEIGDLQQSFYQPTTKENSHQPANKRQVYKNPSNSHYSTSHDFYPQYPSSQPPTMPPVGRNGSAGSSQNGGYYSSNSSDHHQNSNNHLMRRGSLVGRQSMNSRAHSQEEDDGFYDNIAHADDRRFSKGSELFESGSLNRTASTKSHTHGKIGSFFRKIGSGRPPGAAASLVSLNKAGIEPMIQPSGPLMKSSSLSQDPWNKHVLGGPSLPSPNGDKNKGIGQRLKNSFFGSKKRLNG